MGTIMNFSTNGSLNPTKAVLPFLNANDANDAVEAGHEPAITLFGDAVVLMKDSVANAVVRSVSRPLKTYLQPLSRTIHRSVFEAVVQSLVE